MTENILIVEDEKRIRELLVDYFRAANMAPIPMERGDQVLTFLETSAPDLILLDLMLPGVDGKTLCRQIRSFSNVPIIMLTARVEEVDILDGLAGGADDYICKPFSPKEVVARVQTVLRRTRNEFATTTLRKGPFLLNFTARQAYISDQPLGLTPTEFDILKMLLEKPGQVFSRSRLVKEVLGYEHDGYDRTIDSHIKNLRKKIAVHLPDAKPIESVYGTGYRFSASIL